jgi:hypothetical protein
VRLQPHDQEDSSTTQLVEQKLTVQRSISGLSIQQASTGGLQDNFSHPEEIDITSDSDVLLSHQSPAFLTVNSPHGSDIEPTDYVHIQMSPIKLANTLEGHLHFASVSKSSSQMLPHPSSLSLEPVELKIFINEEGERDSCWISKSCPKSSSQSLIDVTTEDMHMTCPNPHPGLSVLRTSSCESTVDTDICCPQLLAMRTTTTAFTSVGISPDVSPKSQCLEHDETDSLTKEDGCDLKCVLDSPSATDYKNQSAAMTDLQSSRLIPAAEDANQLRLSSDYVSCKPAGGIASCCPSVSAGGTSALSSAGLAVVTCDALTMVTGTGKRYGRSNSTLVTSNILQSSQPDFLPVTAKQSQDIQLQLCAINATTCDEGQDVNGLPIDSKSCHDVLPPPHNYHASKAVSTSEVQSTKRANMEIHPSSIGIVIGSAESNHESPVTSVPPSTEDNDFNIPSDFTAQFGVCENLLKGGPVKESHLSKSQETQTEPSIPTVLLVLARDHPVMSKEEGQCYLKQAPRSSKFHRWKTRVMQKAGQVITSAQLQCQKLPGLAKQKCLQLSSVI